MNSFCLILDNRISFCRNYSLIPLKYKNNVANNSSHLNKKYAALAVMSPLLLEVFVQRPNTEHTDGTPALGGSWVGCLLKPLSTSKFFFFVTTSDTGGDTEDLITWCVQRAYYPRDGWAAVCNFHCWQTKRKWPLVATVEMSEERKHEQWESATRKSSLEICKRWACVFLQWWRHKTPFSV